MEGYSITMTEEQEMKALEAYGDPGDGPHVTYRPVAGVPDLGGRIGRGLRFEVDDQGGGKLYAGGLGSRLVSRVKVWRP